MEILKEENGLKVSLEYDDCPECPWGNWDMFTTVSTVSNRHIGQKGALEFSSHSEFEDWANEKMEAGEEAHAVEAYEFCEDAVLYYTKAQRIKEFGKGPQACKKARACLKAEAKTWAQWVNNEVYGYIVETLEGEHVDSCWGFYGYEYAKKEALEAFERAVKGAKQAEQMEKTAFAL